MARLEIYKDNAGEFRWRLVAKNGRIIADCGEGYSTASNARRAARRLIYHVNAIERFSVI